MDERKQEEQERADGDELKLPEDRVEDLEPDAKDTAEVRGGFAKVRGID